MKYYLSLLDYLRWHYYWRGKISCDSRILNYYQPWSEY